MRSTDGNDTLFARVVEVSGLASLIGKGTVRRALRDVGSSPESANRQTYVRALPALRARMAAFLSPQEVEEATKRIEQTIKEG